MADNPIVPDLKQLDIDTVTTLVTPTLDRLFGIYSESLNRYDFPQGFLERVKVQGYPGWLQFYDEDWQKSCLNSETELVGFGKLDLPLDDSSIQVSGLPDLLKRISSTNVENIKPPPDFEKKVIETLLRHMVFINNLVCLLHYKESISDLIPKARKGDQDALVKILKVDKGIICADWVLERVRQAQITGDWKFLEKLGRAIAKTPGTGRIQHLKLAFLLNLLWQFGMNKMSRREIFEFLEKRGLYGKEYGIDDIQSLSQFLHRIGLTKPRRPKSNTN